MPQKKSGFKCLFLTIIFLLNIWPNVSQASVLKQKTVVDRTKYVDKYFTSDLKTGNQDYIYLAGQKIASIDNHGNIYYNLDDHLASPVLITDSSGQIVTNYDYQSFGKLQNSTSSIDYSYQFSDKELDSENNWQYFGARYYDNVLGRFSSLDPVYLQSVEQYLSDPQQLNAYSYARNNPLKLVDQSGEKVSEYQPYYPVNKSYATGDLLGTYRGVAVKSGGILSGQDKNPYQCVDLFQRFTASQYGVKIGGLGKAENYGKQELLNQFNGGKNSGDFIVYKNGGKIMPQENDIMTWSHANGVGHIGVISEVVFDEKSGSGHVYTLEQNYGRAQGLYEQSFQRTYDQYNNPVYTVAGRGAYKVQAWTRYQNQSLAAQTNNYTGTLHSPASQNYIYYNQ